MTKWELRQKIEQYTLQTKPIIEINDGIDITKWRDVVEPDAIDTLILMSGANMMTKVYHMLMEEYIERVLCCTISNHRSKLRIDYMPYDLRPSVVPKEFWYRIVISNARSGAYMSMMYERIDSKYLYHEQPWIERIKQRREGYEYIDSFLGD